MMNIETLPMQEIARFCRKWQIVELSLFGSVLRADFNPESDVDVLAAFSHQSERGLFDHVQMQQELQSLLGRRVDLISRRALDYSQNRILQTEILNTAKVIYRAAEMSHAEKG
jgi:predicted nucleotidyltransferase